MTRRTTIIPSAPRRQTIRQAFPRSHHRASLRGRTLTEIQEYGPSGPRGGRF